VKESRLVLLGQGGRCAVVRGCIPGLELVGAALWSAVAFLGWSAPRCGPRSHSWVGWRRAVVRGRIPGLELVGAALWSAVAFLGWCWSRPSLVLEAIDSSALAVVRQHEAHNGRQVYSGPHVTVEAEGLALAGAFALAAFAAHVAPLDKLAPP
jgi:hypothetical protein